MAASAAAASVAGFGLLWSMQVGAVTTAAECVVIADDGARLACYDQALQRPAAPAVVDTAATGAPTTGTATPPLSAGPPVSARDSLLWHMWDMEPGQPRSKTFEIRPYWPAYVLPLRYSSNPNRTPNTPTQGAAISNLPMQRIEGKYQISLRTKVWDQALGDNGDLWLAYTQQSNWQVYNGAASRPFRETDYEPEAIFALRTHGDVFGLQWRTLNLGLVHQSNGRSDPYSRSWNRIYAQFGLEKGEFSLLVRPWIRLHEDPATDNNPDIRQYMGSGDVRAIWHDGKQTYSVLGRYSPSGQRGAVQLDWAFPIAGPLKGYLQALYGYGESMIDYNHKQAVIGVGLLLLPWE